MLPRPSSKAVKDKLIVRYEEVDDKYLFEGHSAGFNVKSVIPVR